MSLFIGIGLGVGAYKWPKFGIVSIGLFSGGIVGVIFYTICFSHFGQGTSLEVQKQLTQGSVTLNYVE